VAGILILQHGGQKILGYPSPGSMGTVPPFSWPAGISGLLELVLGFLLLIGLFTRIAAFFLSGEMAVAYFMVHAKQAFWPIHNKGELAVIYCFVFLYLCVTGGGPLSLDRLFWRRSPPPASVPPAQT
jgi:putative oxidoreductase